ncbi:MAG: S46 family peptidase [Tannerellaceae bacterium]
MKKVIVSLAVALLTQPLLADEGMWLLPLLKQQKFDEMKALGLELEAKDIYSPDSSSLKDAVVIFGGGCTGEMISPEGLLITNHHCGYGQIQQHSSVEHDYLTDGFWAMSREQELPNPGLTVTFIDAIDDVTDYVKEDLKSDTDPNSMKFLSASYLNKLAEKKVGAEFLKNNPGTAVEIKPFFGGNKYYMFTKKIFSDVRLVGAPPSSIGKFGADTDNWVWPRHTGDFSLFRVYADANGNPAPYSTSNVPLKPKRYFKLSTGGVQENDYAMVMGFPGTTNRYYTSWEVAERRDIDNAVRINIRNLRQQAMLEEMLADPQVRIQYASKYAGSTNAYKNAIGTNWAINKRDFEGVKKQMQDELLAWSQKNCRSNYIEAIQTLESIVADRADLRFRRAMLDEALLRGIEYVKVPASMDTLQAALIAKDKKAIAAALPVLQQAFDKFQNKDYSPAVDRKIAKVLLKEYTKLVPAGKRPAYLELIDTKFNGDTDAFVDFTFDTSIFASKENLAAFMKKPSLKQLNADPMMNLAASVQEENATLKKALADFDSGYAIANRAYLKGLMEMKGELTMAPDANFSLRITYGQVKGYRPTDAVTYDATTTLDGVMDKEDPNNWEFVVSDKLKELYKQQDFGRYANEQGKQPVAFAATTHTTGGNSGSPVLNSRGELIGTNFDRNWEGVGGDIEYLPDYQRSIIVDVRYVLFVIDKYAGAGYLLDEMDIVE